jgi:hypothetical protein
LPREAESPQPDRGAATSVPTSAGHARDRSRARIDGQTVAGREVAGRGAQGAEERLSGCLG